MQGKCRVNKILTFCTFSAWQKSKAQWVTLKPCKIICFNRQETQIYLHWYIIQSGVLKRIYICSIYILTGYVEKLKHSSSSSRWPQVSGKYSLHRSCLLELTNTAEVKKSRFSGHLFHPLQRYVIRCFSPMCLLGGISFIHASKSASLLFAATYIVQQWQRTEKEEGITEKQEMWLDF